MNTVRRLWRFCDCDALYKCSHRRILLTIGVTECFVTLIVYRWHKLLTVQVGLKGLFPLRLRVALRGER